MNDTQCLSVTLYSPVNGMLLAHRTGQLASIQAGGLPHVIGEHDENKKYVDLSGGEPHLIPRPHQGAAHDKAELVADGKDVIVFSGLPVPCTVHIGEHHYEVEDGELEWGTLLPGSYRVRVEAFPYLDWETEVIAVAGGASPDAR